MRSTDKPTLGCCRSSGAASEPAEADGRRMIGRPSPKLQQQAGLQAGVPTVVVLRTWCFNPPGKNERAQEEWRVGDDSSGHRRLRQWCMAKA